MTLSPWFTMLWIFGTLLNAVVALIVLRSNLFRAWPSLFLISVDEVILFFLLHHTKTYASYFWVYWWNAALQAVLQVWLAWDVFRSLPGIWAIPLRWRLQSLTAAVALGVATFWCLNGSQGDKVENFVLMLNRSAAFAWGLIFFCCLAGIMAVGFGFTLTGVRVASGMIVRLLVSMIAALVYASPATIRQKADMNIFNSIIDLGVSLYWGYALYKAPNAELRFAKDWKSNHHTLNPPVEDNGQQ